MMKRLLLLMTGLALSICMADRAGAQTGDLTIGLRMTPDGAGLTGKYFLDRNVAFEAQLNAGGVFGLEGQSFTAVGLLEYHVPLPDPSWKVFFGGGFHGGVWDHDGSYVSAEGHVDKGSEAIFGIDGIGGVAYSFKSLPLSITADFKPAINFVTDVDFFPHNMFGFGARYFFGR